MSVSADTVDYVKMPKNRLETSQAHCLTGLLHTGRNNNLFKLHQSAMKIKE